MCFYVSSISVSAGGDFLLLKFMQSKTVKKNMLLSSRFVYLCVDSRHCMMFVINLYENWISEMILFSCLAGKQ